MISLGKDDPLINTEPCPVRIEGYAIPAHTDDYGHVYSAGFDIVSLSIGAPVEFASSGAVVYAGVGQELHWKDVPQAVQWADDSRPTIIKHSTPPLTPH